jgi:hypothetical protein
MLKTEQIK